MSAIVIGVDRDILIDIFHPTSYALSHVDFHFGSVNTQGSEHTMDGSMYAMEMEMVFYDGTFADNAAAAASTNADALVTISHLFSVKLRLNRTYIIHNIQ